jgi:hypothetical protein
MRISGSFSLDCALFGQNQASSYHVSGGDMPNEDFVKKMRAALNTQREQRGVSDKVKLHDADIIKASGSRNWDKLTKELAATVNQIDKGLNAIDYTHDGDRVAIRNLPDNKTLSVTFEPLTANITYEGVVEGQFKAEVRGNELSYAPIRIIGNSQIKATLSTIGKHMTLEQISEFLISSVIS